MSAEPLQLPFPEEVPRGYRTVRIQATTPPQPDARRPGDLRDDLHDPDRSLRRLRLGPRGCPRHGADGVSGGHGGDALHRAQLRRDVPRVSHRRLGVLLRPARHPPQRRLHRRLGPAAGLPADPAAALRVQRAGAEPPVPGDSQACVHADLPGVRHAHQPARHHPGGPLQPAVPDRRTGGPGDLPGGWLPGAGGWHGQRPADPGTAAATGAFQPRPGDEGGVHRGTVVPRLRRDLHPRRRGQGRSGQADWPRLASSCRPGWPPTSPPA